MFQLTIDHIRINELKHAPNLPQVVDELLYFLEEERKKRNLFLETLNDDVKAEFIGGEIILNSPVKRKHYLVVKWLSKLMDTYASVKKIGEVATEKVLIHLTRNDFEPDIVFFDNHKAAQFHNNTMLHPAPGLVVEVLSDSTKLRDRGIKFEDYAYHQIAEYWIIDADTEMIEQYFLNDKSQYELFLKTNSGKIISKVIGGFEIDVKAIFSAEENLKALRNIL